MTPSDSDPRTQSSASWFLERIRRRLDWARRLGLFVGEDKLHPVDRLRTTSAKRRWRRLHSVAPRAVPVFVVGLQRSGTNMLVRGLEASPEFEVHNEDDTKAFRRFQLKSNDQIRALVTRSGHSYILFKPLCDSYRVPELLDDLGAPSAGKAIWIYRHYEGRARSAVATFGSDNLNVLRELSAGRGRDRWQAQGLSTASWNVIASTDYQTLSPEAAAALFWCVRNEIYFEQGLKARSDVMIVSYEAFLRDPADTMRPLCNFLEFTYDDRLIAHIRRRPERGRGELVLPLAIRERCDDLERRLDAAAAEKARAFR